MEVLHFHLSCSEDEAQPLIVNPHLKLNEVPANFDQYNFCCYGHEPALPRLFIKMIEDAFGNIYFFSY